MITVNARTEPGYPYDQKRRPPGVRGVLSTSAFAPMGAVSFDLVEEVRRYGAIQKREMEVVAAFGKIVSDNECCVEAIQEPRQASFHFVEIDFSDLSDPREQLFFTSLPTNLDLPPEVVARDRRRRGAPSARIVRFETFLRAHTGYRRAPGK